MQLKGIIFFKNWIFHQKMAKLKIMRFLSIIFIRCLFTNLCLFSESTQNYVPSYFFYTHKDLFWAKINWTLLSVFCHFSKTKISITQAPNYGRAQPGFDTRNSGLDDPVDSSSNQLNYHTSITMRNLKTEKSAFSTLVFEFWTQSNYIFGCPGFWNESKFYPPLYGATRFWQLRLKKK